VVANSFSSCLALSRVASEDHHPHTDELICSGIFCVYQILLYSDEDGEIQRDPPFLCGSLDDGLLLSIVGDHIDIGYLIYRFGNLLITPCECVSQIFGGVYLFKIGFLNFLVVLQRPRLCLSGLYLGSEYREK
jgi:hypothetical protein